MATRPIEGAAYAAFDWTLNRLRVGSLEVRYPNGRCRTFRGRALGPHAEISVVDPVALVRRVVSGGGLGFAEAYLEGAWDTPDLPALLEVAARNNDALIRTDGTRSTAERTRRLWSRFRPRHSSAPIDTIGDHYDLGNDFYAAWLDETMTYSSALFDGVDAELEAAQLAKYEQLAMMAQILPGHHVLEIGCGWGGFAEYAAGVIGCRVRALTLSREQAAYARTRMRRARLDDRVEIAVRDFRTETGRYDRVVSIEMIESVDETVWPSLFAAIHDSLSPGGRAVMQAITIAPDLYESLLGREDFIKRHIFPGGALPTLDVLRDLASSSGLSWTKAAAHGASYAETLSRWLQRFDRAWPEISAHGSFDERFRRMWRYYLAYCEAGFRTGRIDGYQIALERPDDGG